MKYQALVINGCSYAYKYATGNGHWDLASRLGISHAESLAFAGSANSRILRTTLKHSYQTDQPTLYVLGMTFVSRGELPICEPDNDFEGRWANPQNQDVSDRWQPNWSNKDSEQFVQIKLKSEIYSIVDRTEDLMYRMISTIHDLRSRGHAILMYQQACNLYQEHLPDSRLALFSKFKEIVHGFEWRAIAYQHSQGVQGCVYPPGTQYVPPDMTHPEPGHHAVVNEFLTNYIHQCKIMS